MRGMQVQRTLAHGWTSALLGGDSMRTWRSADTVATVIAQ